MYLRPQQTLKPWEISKYLEKIKIFKDCDDEGNRTEISVGNPPKNPKNGHMWGFSKLDDKYLDHFDRMFIKDPTSFTKIEILGLHTYGYQAFFKPDLIEASHLINTQISVKDLDGPRPISRIYLTTVSHPYNGNNWNVFAKYCWIDNRQEGSWHRGKSIFYVLYNSPSTITSTVSFIPPKASL